MKDGSIILEAYEDMNSWLLNLVGKAICFFTDSPYVHVLVYVDNWIYESTVWKSEKGKIRTGARKIRPVRLNWSKKNVVLEPIRLGPQKAEQLKYYLEGTLNEVPYNILKLIALALVYPTRWVWNKLKWVPFDREIFGEVCSTYIDEAFKKVGVDLLPNKFEGYTAPVDFIKSPKLRKRKKT